MKPLIFEFQTKKGNRYVYDACTDYTYPVEDIDVDVINNFYDFENNGLRKLLKKGYQQRDLTKSYSKITEWINHDKAFFPPWTGSSEFISENEYQKKLVNVTQICLELTQYCNLRCRYCIYRDNFPLNRNHGNSIMKWDIAKRSIDYFTEITKSIYRTKNSFYLSFYGGEPLSNFALLKKCVEYIINIKQQNNDIKFNITTNGTLLNEEIAYFLIKHDFDLLISLDGPSLEHDKNRIFKNGEPTYNLIFNNLNLIKKIDEEYFYKKVTFNAVHTYSTNLKNVFSYFKNIFGGNIGVRFESGDHYRYGTDYSNQMIIRHNKHKEYLFNKFIEFEKNDTKENAFFYLLKSFFGADYYQFRKRRYILPENYILNGATCIPGTRKIYVTVDGKFHMCEQIHPSFSIGDCWQGVDYKIVEKLYEKFRTQILSECHRCIAVHHCKICFARISEEGKLVKGDLCNMIRNDFKNFLLFYYTILEDFPKAFSGNLLAMQDKDLE